MLRSKPLEFGNTCLQGFDVKFGVVQPRVTLSKERHMAQAFSFMGSPLLNADKSVIRNQQFLNHACLASV